jgi:hypothetical protein
VLSELAWSWPSHGGIKFWSLLPFGADLNVVNLPRVILLPAHLSIHDQYALGPCALFEELFDGVAKQFQADANERFGLT